MSPADSALDSDLIAQARRLLETPIASESTWPVLGAAAFAACMALALATAMILAPPTTTRHVVERASSVESVVPESP